MFPLDESLEKRLERQRREHDQFMKQLRRERRSLFAWAIYMCVLPFVHSPDLILLMLGILMIFYGQFIYVMGMD